MMKNYPKEYFNLIQEDEKKIFDKELKTKQLSYFQDAMLRFGKNKYNVIASFILLLLIILSIVVPILTPTALYTDVNSTLRLLPPRVPIVENLGILDGTKFYKNVSVDLDTISAETGLGYPTANFNPGGIGELYTPYISKEVSEKYKDITTFDPEKAKWFNQEWIKKTDNEKLASLVKPFYDDAQIEVHEPAYLVKVIGLIKAGYANKNILAAALFIKLPFALWLFTYEKKFFKYFSLFILNFFFTISVFWKPAYDRADLHSTAELNCIVLH